MTFKLGHRVGGEFKLFAHTCVAENETCSVKRWLEWKEMSRKYEAARRGLKYFGSNAEKSSEGAGECA